MNLLVSAAARIRGLVSSRTRLVVLLALFATLLPALLGNWLLRGQVASPECRFCADLVAYWDFNDRIGTSARNRMGPSGNFVGAPKWNRNGAPVPYANPGSLTFNGTSDAVQTQVPLTPTFTWSVWVRPEVYATYKAIFSHMTGRTLDAYLGLDQNGKVSVWELNGNVSQLTTTSPVVPLNTWTHLALVREGNGLAAGYRLYVNGALAGSAPTRQLTAESPLFIGRQEDKNTYQYWKGQIDEARVYGIALSADQVRALYDGSAFAPLACGDTCAAGTCGNAAREGLEECDDGNQNNLDACPNNCYLPVCGDVIREGTEQCDSGPAGSASCTPQCTGPTCWACTSASGHYDFDDGSGTSARSYTENAHTAQINAGSWSTDHAPTAYDNDGSLAFDGRTTYAKTPVVLGKAFTLSAWVKRRTTGDPYKQIFSVRESGGSPFYVTLTNGVGSVWLPDTSTSNFGITIPADTWTHVAFVREGDQLSAGYKAYVNGTVTGQADTKAWNLTNSLWIGAREDQTTQSKSQTWLGLIDEVRTYPFSMNAVEVQALYDGTAITGATDCPTYCRAYARCGDGVAQAGEQCDDGDTHNGQYGRCTSDCSGPGPRCGDGQVNGPEQCDGGSACRSDCTFLPLSSSAPPSSPPPISSPPASSAAPSSAPPSSSPPVSSFAPPASSPIPSSSAPRPSSTPLSSSVATGPCGNGLPDPDERCDDGPNNGQPGFCNATCDGAVALMCTPSPAGQQQSSLRPAAPPPSSSAAASSDDASSVSVSSSQQNVIPPVITDVNAPEFVVWCSCLPDDAGSGRACRQVAQQDCLAQGGVVTTAGDLSTCQAEQQALGCQACWPLDPDFNDPRADRINVVLGPYGFWRLDDVRSLGQQFLNALFALPPYDRYRDRIQFWYTNTARGIAPQGTSFDDLCVSVCTEMRTCSFAENPTATILPVGLCNAACRSLARMDGTFSIVSTTEPLAPKVFVHEFQHQFAQLRDEYAEDGKPDLPGYPNCADDRTQAESWWGSVVAPDVGYYDGCSYDTTNVRPHLFSIMRNSRYATELGTVNVRRVEELLGAYSGSSPLVADTSLWNRIVAQLLGDTPPESSYALELSMRRTEDGGYVEAGRKTISVPQGVKPSFQDGYQVTVTAGDRRFTQTFTPSSVVIGERFDDPEGRIALDGIEVTPRELVTVFVSLGDLVPQPDGTVQAPDGQTFPLIVASAPCSSWDADPANDCAGAQPAGTMIAAHPAAGESSVSSAATVVISSIWSEPESSASMASFVSESASFSSSSMTVAIISSAESSSAPNVGLSSERLAEAVPAVIKEPAHHGMGRIVLTMVVLSIAAAGVVIIRRKSRGEPEDGNGDSGEEPYGRQP